MQQTPVVLPRCSNRRESPAGMSVPDVQLLHWEMARFWITLLRQKSPCNAVLQGNFSFPVFALNQFPQHIIGGVCVLSLADSLIPQSVYSGSCKADFLIGENCLFTGWEKIHFQHQISCFLPTCIIGSLPIIVITQRLQQNNFIGARQLDFSHNPIAFPSFSCAFRLFLSNAWA